MEFRIAYLRSKLFVIFCALCSLFLIMDPSLVNATREWRQAGGLQPGMHSISQGVHDPLPSPTVSASHKRQKITQSVPSQSFGGPSASFHPQPVTASHQPSSSAVKRGPVSGSKGKKHKPVS